MTLPKENVGMIAHLDDGPAACDPINSDQTSFLSAIFLDGNFEILRVENHYADDRST